MKIAIICDFIKHQKKRGASGASYRVRYLTALKMAQKGMDVTFIYPEKSSKYVVKQIINDKIKGSLKVIGTPGILPPKLRSGGFGLIDCIYKAVYTLLTPFDIIQVVSGHRPSNFIPCILGKYIKGNVIIDECWEWLGSGGYAENRKGLFGRFVGLYDRLFEIQLKRYYHAIIVISSALKKRFEKSNNTFVLFGGAENTNLIPYDRAEARRKLGMPDSDFIIGMSNVIKGDHNDNSLFFKSFQKISEEFQNTYLMATSIDRNYLKEIEKKYCLTGRLIYPGYLEFSQYNLFLSACNLFVLPYSNSPINRGRWPNKIGDYLCLNRPVVTNPTGDIKILFHRYKLGKLCEANSEAFYDIVKKFIMHPEKKDYQPDDSLFVVKNILSFDARVERMLKICHNKIRA